MFGIIKKMLLKEDVEIAKKRALDLEIEYLERRGELEEEFKKKAVDLDFNSFDAGDIVRMGVMWNENGRILKKLEAVILTKIIKDMAESPRDIEFARKVVPEVFKAFEGFSKIEV